MFRRDGSRPGEVVPPDRHPGERDQGLPCQSRPPHRSLLPAPAPSGPSRSTAAAPTPTSTTCGPCSNGPRGTLRPNAASTRKSRGSRASAKRSTRQRRSAIPVRSSLTASTRVGVRPGYGGAAPNATDGNAGRRRIAATGRMGGRPRHLRLVLLLPWPGQRGRAVGRSGARDGARGQSGRDDAVPFAPSNVINSTPPPMSERGTSCPFGVGRRIVGCQAAVATVAARVAAVFAAPRTLRRRGRCACAVRRVTFG